MERRTGPAGQRSGRQSPPARVVSSLVLGTGRAATWGRGHTSHLFLVAIQGFYLSAWILYLRTK